MGRVSHTLHRLETFYFIENSGKSPRIYINGDKESSQLDSVNDWIEFSRVEMFSECCKRLASGQLKAAMLIWKRHQV